MHSETSSSATTIMGVTGGLLAGMYQSFSGGSLVHTILTTTISAVVSCLGSFFTQHLLKKIKEKT